MGYFLTWPDCWVSVRYCKSVVSSCHSSRDWAVNNLWAADGNQTPHFLCHFWGAIITNQASKGRLSSHLNEWELTQQTLFFTTHPRNYHLGVYAPVRTVKVEFNGSYHCNLTYCTCWSSKLKFRFVHSVLQNLIIQPVVTVDATECLWKAFWRRSRGTKRDFVCNNKVTKK